MNLENMFTYQAIALCCNHINTKKLKDTAEKYNYNLTFSSLVNTVDEIGFFHVFLVSSKTPSFISVVKQIQIAYPNSLCVTLLDNADLTIQKENLFWLIPSNTTDIECNFYQLWQWIMLWTSQKYSFKKQHVIQLAEGELSLLEETYVKNNKIYNLTRKQVDILKVLLQYRGEIVSRENILKMIWGMEQKIVSDRVIDTNIVFLRKMFGDQGRNPKYLQTIFGQGYRLTLD